MKKTIQDVLSSVKTALTSDTGKAIGAGLAGVAAGALLGGEGGVQAVGGIGSAIQGIRERRKKEAIEAENRDLRNLQRTKAELELASAKETQKLQPMREREAQLRLDEIQERINTSKEKREATYGMINRDDVAIEPKPVKSSGKSTTEKTPKFKPTPVPVTGPESTSALDVADEEELSKNVTRIQSTAAKEAAKLAQDLGIVGLGREYLRSNNAEVRRKFADKVKSYNFTPEYEKAFWKEFQAQVETGNVARAQQLLSAKPDLSNEEQRALAQPAMAGMATGAVAGAAMGTAIAPGPGTAIGGIAGGLIGGFTGPGVFAAMESQKDVAPTPAVAGADKTAADMASYSISPEATALINNLSRNAQPGGFDAISQQLPQLPDFKALSVGDQERVMIELENRIPRRPLPRIGPYYRTPQEQAAAQQPVNSLRDTINDMGQWATRKLGIGG